MAFDSDDLVLYALVSAGIALTPRLVAPVFLCAVLRPIASCQGVAPSNAYKEPTLHVEYFTPVA